MIWNMFLRWASHKNQEAKIQKLVADASKRRKTVADASERRNCRPLGLRGIQKTKRTPITTVCVCSFILPNYYYHPEIFIPTFIQARIIMKQTTIGATHQYFSINSDISFIFKCFRTITSPTQNLLLPYPHTICCDRNRPFDTDLYPQTLPTSCPYDRSVSHTYDHTTNLLTAPFLKNRICGIAPPASGPWKS